MTLIEIIELSVVGLLCVLHVVSNFVSAKCSCKLCASFKRLLGKEEPPKEEENLTELLVRVLDALEKT